MKKVIVNVELGTTEEKDFTNKELEDYQKLVDDNNKLVKAEAEAQALKDSAKAKLSALGLTPEEIAAITR
tara:strand:+ start:748 stop:957 length:210 start_codon:yes stop_codon:yes gene_type:complete